MSTSNDTGRHVTVSSARPVTVVRYRPDVTGNTAQTAHLVPLPLGGPTGVTTTLCGALLRHEDIEPVTPEQGMPCTICLISHAVNSPPPPATTRIDPDPLVATATYRAWGWPVTPHRNQIALHLDDNTTTLIIPVLLATDVTTILTQQHRPVPVLAHPYAPAHRILLVTEPFKITLPWPPSVRQITGTLHLPPTMTPHGPITWTQLPQPNALPLCREIDVLTALHTALNDRPAPPGPLT